MLSNYFKIRYKEYTNSGLNERFCIMLGLLNNFRYVVALFTFVLAFRIEIFWLSSSLLLLSALIIEFLLFKFKHKKHNMNIVGLFGVFVDFSLAGVVMFVADNARIELCLNLFLVVIIIESAFLWKMFGSILASFVSAGITSYWILYRNDFQYDADTVSSTIIRIIIFLIISIGIGVLMSVFQDTTNELARQLELQEKTIEDMREVADLKDDFIAVASHELRTPIAALMGYLNIVNNPKLDIKDKIDVDDGIERQVKRLHELVEDLLAVGLIDSNRSVAVGEKIDFKRFVTEIVRDLEQSNDGRKIELDYKDESSDVKTVNCDANFLRRILNNIIQNSIKYSDKETKVLLNISKSQNKINFEIQDFGYGIDKSELQNVFNKFHRAKSNRNISGTGLGLYIVKGLVTSMGGDISIDSKTNVGTTMKFYITI